MAEIVDILKASVQQRASDILLMPGEPPNIRVDGVLRNFANLAAADSAECKRWIYCLLNADQKARMERDKELDYAFTMPSVARFRVNAFLQNRGVAAVLRVIPEQIPAPDEIGLSASILNLANLPRGLVLITGSTGSGKTTTLASMLDTVNASQNKHILMIEDPIEYVFENKNSLVNQREVGAHTDSFSNALRFSLRQNPDIIMVGEMRDAETIALAINAAETGHLCFSTLHTQDAPSTINRIIDEFPGEQQAKIGSMVASALVAVVSQQLLPRIGGGRVCAREVMMMNTAIASLIREGKVPQIYGAMESGASAGMVSMDQSLAALVKEKLVKLEDALLRARNPDSVKKLAEASGTVVFDHRPPLKTSPYG